jgi:hypothetical protein
MIAVGIAVSCFRVLKDVLWGQIRNRMSEVIYYLLLDGVQHQYVCVIEPFCHSLASVPYRVRSLRRAFPT